MSGIRPTKRSILQILAGVFSFGTVGAAQARRVETGAPYSPHPEDLNPSRQRPKRGQVLVTWTSQSGRQFTFDVDAQRDAMVGQADVNGTLP